MKKAINMHEAKTQFSRLVQRVLAGEEIVIANRGVPVALLVPVRSPKAKRQLGFYEGKLRFRMTSMRHCRMRFCMRLKGK